MNFLTTPRFLAAALSAFLAQITTGSEPHGVRTLASTGNLFAREITASTRGAIDWAAYEANPLLVEPPPKEGHFAGQTMQPAIADLEFAGAIVKGSATDAPRADLGTPLVWQPLLDWLRAKDEQGAAPLVDAGYFVAKTRWGARKPTQSISHFFWSDTARGEAWVRITFKRGFEVGAGILDNDGDGLPEVYAKLTAVISPAIHDLLKDYVTRSLAPDEADRAISEIAAALYDKHYVFARDPAVFDPVTALDGTSRALLGDNAARKPGGVIERPSETEDGRPTGGRFHCLFYFSKPHSSLGRRHQWIRVADSGNTGLARFRAKLRESLGAGGPTTRVIPGREPGVLFFRRALEYLAADDLSNQKTDPMPVLADFAKQLKERGIDFMFVPIPVKASVYPDWFADVPADLVPNTAGLAAFETLRSAGVRVLELGPVFREARKSNPSELLYLKTDTHWTPRGAEIAAEAVAAELTRTGLARGSSVFGVRTANIAFVGNLAGMLDEVERHGVALEKHAATQVLNPDGAILEDNAPGSPVVVLGDSYLTIYQREQCGSAGFAAHLARALAQPIDLIANQGGGPQTRLDLARRGASYLARAKCVILAMSERDLFNYFGGWKPVELPKE